MQQASVLLLLFAFNIVSSRPTQPLTKVGANSTSCPDGKSACPSDNTCCLVANGRYDCCPFHNGVCCSDGEHCCPENYDCDEKGDCKKQSTERTPLIVRQKSTSPSITDKGCGLNLYCHDYETCCYGDGCCPFEDGVCCSDGKHCCSSGYYCDYDKCYKYLSHQLVKTATPGITNLKKRSNFIVLVKKASTNTICRNNNFECPPGSTCCQVNNTTYACCSLPNAQCCYDGKHCCAHNQQCTSDGNCEVQSTASQMEKKQLISTKDIPGVKVVWCDDSKHYCPDGNTCCRLPTGEYGCCPVPHATCCGDGKHCCPNGYSCDFTTNRCMPSLFAKVTQLDVKVSGVKEVVCDATSTCPDGNTCCPRSTGGYGCCPQPNAVCCGDGSHCCPSGYSCDLHDSKCTPDISVAAVSMKQPVSRVKDVPCDSTNSCPDNTTCCRTSSGGWGCCDGVNAVCCSDDKCCASGQTCCPSADNKGCCPVLNGVCCDNDKCCPSGYRCAGDLCVRGTSMLPMSEKVPNLKKVLPTLMKVTTLKNVNLLNSVKEVQCDSSHVCPDNTTCCQSSAGWKCCPSGPNAECCSNDKCCPSGNTCCSTGCCPHPNAVCCSDSLHCCPSGSRCEGTGCTIKGLIAPRLEKVPILAIESVAPVKVSDVKRVNCDTNFYCPDGSSCCNVSYGWGCCPLLDANCCNDNHCCPKDYTCVADGTKCHKNGLEVPSVKKQSALSSVKNVICDSVHQCPDTSTCCLLSNGQWGCCPVPNAVCCQDKIHCCPSGYTCSGNSCVKDVSLIPMLKKQPALTQQPSTEQCDATHYCQQGNTCCRLNSGGWGCCPVPQATCCSDGIHCCPNGYYCNGDQCTRSTISVPMMTKQPSVTKQLAIKEVSGVQCDNFHQCPDGNTCCKLANGQWGCCDHVNAVCCSDGKHCCPSGYTCDLSDLACKHTVPMLKKQPATKKELAIKDVPCDATRECPDSYTCCILQSGQWGCCDHPDATCCSDRIHCCPSGYTCNLSDGTCKHASSGVIEMLKKIASSAAVKKVSHVDCDDTDMCPDGDTCCRFSPSQWGCCPHPFAVCCNDGRHCCPHGYACNSDSTQCSNDTLSMPSSKKRPSLKKQLLAVEKTVSNHICPDGQTECKDDNTCCMLEGGDGKYGCCPFPNAVCCTDGSKCCPNGQSCDKSGTCVFIKKVSQFEKKSFSRNDDNNRRLL